MAGEINVIAKIIPKNAAFIYLVNGSAVEPPILVEVRTDDPGSPANGQIWLRSDLAWLLFIIGSFIGSI